MNSVVIENVDGAPPWPRKQSKKEKEKEVKELESGNEGEEELGLDEMFSPMPLIACLPF